MSLVRARVPRALRKCQVFATDPSRSRGRDARREPRVLGRARWIAAALKPGETAPDRPADPGAPPVTTGEPAPAADTPAGKAWDLPCDEHYLPVFSVCEWASPWGELAGGLLVILPMLAMILACACVYPRSHEGYQQSGRLG